MEVRSRWNPLGIPHGFTEEQVAAVDEYVSVVVQRLADLEAENAALIADLEAALARGER